MRFIIDKISPLEYKWKRLFDRFMGLNISATIYRIQLKYSDKGYNVQILKEKQIYYNDPTDID